MTNILDTYKKRLNNFDNTKEYFMLLVEEFENILSIFDESYIRGAIEQIKIIVTDKEDFADHPK